MYIMQKLNLYVGTTYQSQMCHNLRPLLCECISALCLGQVVTISLIIPGVLNIVIARI